MRHRPVELRHFLSGDGLYLIILLLFQSGDFALHHA